jgi:signal transduction histidine kinase/ligand-binding sensor domain-containing protein
MTSIESNAQSKTVTKTLLKKSLCEIKIWQLLISLLLGMLLLSSPIHAQLQQEANSEVPASSQFPLHFQQLGVEDGLNQGFVGGIFQDSSGFMWLGTQYGLNRYDGYDVKTYLTDPFDSTSFQGGTVQIIRGGDDGKLWVGTNLEGVSLFDPVTETFKRYPHSANDTSGVTSGTVVDILVGSSGNIWISMIEGGLTRLNPETGNYKRYFHDPEDTSTLASNDLIEMHQDSSGNIWIGSLNALNKFNPETEQVQRFLLDPKAQKAQLFNAPGNNATLAIAPDPHDNNILWLTGKGLIRFNKNTGEHTRFIPDPSQPNHPGNALAYIIPGTGDSDILWATAWQGGLLRFDKNTEQFTRYTHDPNDPNSIASNNLFSLYADQFGAIWVGNNDARGVNYFDPQSGGMKHYGDDKSVWSVFEDRMGTLWLGTRTGLFEVNRISGEMKSYLHNPENSSSLSANTVREIYEDDEGYLWIGTNAGLDKMNRNTGTFTTYSHDPDNNSSITSGEVWSVLEDNSGNLWVGSLGGLNKMDRNTGSFTRYTADPSNSTSLTSSSISEIYEDYSGNLWVGTYNGLHLMDKSSGEFKRYTYDPNKPDGISSGAVLSIHERKQEPGILWIAMLSGLDRFDTQTETFTHYSVEDGLPDNTIYGILEDKDGRLWFSTNRGLSRLDVENQTFKNFGLESGLQALEFNGTAYSKTADGEMFFGGVNGANGFYPDQLLGNPIPPKVSLTNIRLFNNPLKHGPDSPLKSPLQEAQEIHLAHDQNSLAFEYVGLHYLEPEENQYKYMLDGFDEDWIDSGTRRVARYTNLDPGMYTFKVKASNSDGVWSEETAHIQVVISPPWWRTWWAYILYGAILIAGIFAVDRVQRRRLVKKEREKAQKKELEKEKQHTRELREAYNDLEKAHENLKEVQDQLVQQEKLASLGQLTAGIAHEIKNPLNFVNNFSDLSIELVGETKEELKAIGDQLVGNQLEKVEEALGILNDVELNLQKINEHGTRADSIVKSMLQHSRGGSGEMKPTDLNALVKEYVNLSFHGMRASEDTINVDIEMGLHDDVEEVPMIAEDFSRVIVNLCNNAFDAMRSLSAERSAHDKDYKPKLTIRTRQTDSGTTIEIEDNGPGIPADMKDKILQPFFTTKKGTEGTGLGLSITNDIVKAHGGEIDIKSKENEGTIFTVTLRNN